jgi:hypothetical protein
MTVDYSINCKISAHLQDQSLEQEIALFCVYYYALLSSSNSENAIAADHAIDPRVHNSADEQINYIHTMYIMF